MEYSFQFALPDWLHNVAADGQVKFDTPESRMKLTISLARFNVQEQSGGPFGAAVFSAGGRLVSAGVNLVTTRNCSVLHAEIVAVMLAQQALETYDLSQAGPGAFELVTSTEPCAMCLGAIPWSGIRTVLCGARDEDAREIGFDEGDKPADWAGKLRCRGIQVETDLLREEAREVLRLYAKSGNTIYNPGG